MDQLALEQHKQRVNANYAGSKGFHPLLAHPTLDSLEVQATCKYVRGEKLGEGGFGTTFVAEETGGMKGTFAAKVVVLSENETERSRQLSEAALLSSCDSSFILGHVEHQVVDNGKVLIMITEFCDCRDLQCLLNSQRDNGGSPWPEEYVAYVLVQVTVALHYLHHEKNMLHRDIKPRNIFTTTKNLIKLGDFGFSKELKRQGSPGGRTPVAGGGGGLEGEYTLCGTPGFCAPEMYVNFTASPSAGRRDSNGSESSSTGASISAPPPSIPVKTSILGTAGNSKDSHAGKKGATTGKYGLKADMWALGISLYNLINPSAATNIGLGTLVHRAKTGTWDRPTIGGYSDELWKIIKQLLEVDPTKRPNTIQLLGMSYVQTKLNAFVVGPLTSVWQNGLIPDVTFTKVKSELESAREVGRSWARVVGESHDETPPQNSNHLQAPPCNDVVLETHVQYQSLSDDGVLVLLPRCLRFGGEDGLIVDSATFLWEEISQMVYLSLPGVVDPPQAPVHCLSVEVMECGIVSEWYHYHMTSAQEVQRWVELCTPMIRAAFQQQYAGI